MKRKVKRYDEGGILTDRYGNPVKSGSGETVKTRYGSTKEDRPTSSGVDDISSMGKRAGAASPFSGPKEYISESIKEDMEMPSKSASSSDEESTAGKGARNLAMEEPEVKVKEKTVIKKKPNPKYEDTGAKIGSQGDFKIKTEEKKTSGFGPKLSFLTKERLDKSKEAMRSARGMKSGGKVSSASSRGDGIAQRGKTKGRIC